MSSGATDTIAPLSASARFGSATPSSVIRCVLGFKRVTLVILNSRVFLESGGHSRGLFDRIGVGIIGPKAERAFEPVRADYAANPEHRSSKSDARRITANFRKTMLFAGVQRRMFHVKHF